MPDVEMPDGAIVNFPDDMPKAEIAGMIATKFPEIAPQVKGEKFGNYAKEEATGLKEGVKSGSTFGLGDELQAGIAAYSSAPFVDNLTLSDAYDQALEGFRGQQKEARANAPIANTLGEIGGGLVTGAGILKNASSAPTIGRTALQAAISGGARGAGTGAVAGAVYGFGNGEGGIGNRATSMAVGGGLGAVGGGLIGGASGAISNSLAARASRLLEKKRAAMDRQPGPMSGESITPPAPVGIQDQALNKVIERLRADYPDDAQFQKAIADFKSGNATLAELGGEKTKDLALGAAQYPSGKAVTNEFFYGKTPAPGQAPQGGALESARANVTDSIEKNISGTQDFFGSLDDIVEKGRTKAAPLYEKANSQLIQPSETLAKPEIKQAIEAAKKQFPSELQDLSDNSVKVLDYAKRILDDDISAAQRAGQSNYARSRVELKNQLVSEIDTQVPDYAEARKVAGDYLSNKGAMEAGREFKGNSKQIARDFKKLGETEQQAYRAGVVQKVREMADSVKDAGNVHTKIFGTPETRAKLKAVLPDKEFKQLSDDLWASDRIYKLRDRVLGNSTTTSKKISAEEFSNPDNAVLQQIAEGRNLTSGAANAAMQWVKKTFDGLSDKTAGEVARILTTKNDAERWKIMRQIADKSDPKLAAGKANAQALKVYYEIQDMVKPYRGKVPGVAGGQLGSQPLRITVTPQDKNGNDSTAR